jgi:hypothetical protein
MGLTQMRQAFFCFIARNLLDCMHTCPRYKNINRILFFVQNMHHKYRSVFLCFAPKIKFMSFFVEIVIFLRYAFPQETWHTDYYTSFALRFQYYFQYYLKISKEK